MSNIYGTLFERKIVKPYSSYDIVKLVTTYKAVQLMKRQWFWRKELVDTGVFAEIERSRKIKIPSELRDLVYEGNAGTPLKYKYKLNNKVYSFGEMLSFNRYEKEKHIETIFMALETIKDDSLFPFAMDEFSDYWCVELNDNLVVRYNHKTGNVTETNMGIKEFMSKLY